MKTEDLIGTLAADARRRRLPLAAAWWIAAAAATSFAAVVFLAGLGPRPDLGTAVASPRFLFKVAVSVTLAACAFGAARALSRPDGAVRPSLARLAAVPALVVAAAAVELLALPPAAWPVRLVGTNATLCLTWIPLLGIGPLAFLLAALRHGAPTRPAVAGAAAGLLAGGIAAALYAIHCPDDSPLFVAVWYTIAIGGLALLGALITPRIARW